MRERDREREKHEGYAKHTCTPSFLTHLIDVAISRGVVLHDFPSTSFPSGRVTLIGLDSFAANMASCSALSRSNISIRD